MRAIPFALALLMSCLAGSGFGQTRSQVYGSTLTQQTQTFFVQTDYGWQTYDSEAADGNASANTTTISAGGYAGEERLLGVFFTGSKSDTEFDASASDLHTSWQMLTMQFRFANFNPAIIAGQSQMKLRQNGAVVADINGAALGAGLKVALPLTKNIVIYGDGKRLQESTTHDRQGNEVEMTAWTEVEAGASVDIIEKYADFVVGYRNRQYGFKLDNQDFTEVQTAPFLGFRLGLYF